MSHDVPSNVTDITHQFDLESKNFLKKIAYLYLLEASQEAKITSLIRLRPLLYGFGPHPHCGAVYPRKMINFDTFLVKRNLNRNANTLCRYIIYNAGAA